MTQPETHPDPDLLALAALPAEPADPEVSEHLQLCSVCRVHVEELRHTVQLARNEVDAGPLPTPPPRVWRAVMDELALDELPGAPTPDTSAGEPAAAVSVLNGSPRQPTPSREQPTTGRAAPRRIRLGAALAAAAVTLIAGLGIGATLGRGGAEPPPQAAPVARLSPLGFADPDARGSVGVVERDGTRRLLVQLDGVTNLAGGDYLEAWLMDGTGTRLISLGALTAQDGQFRGDFALPAGVPLDEFSTVDVSAERWDGDPKHSAVSLLRGDLA